MYVKKSNEVEMTVVPSGIKTTRQVLISAQEGQHFAMRRFVMEPGGGMPRHTNTVEHEQYVLGGKARIGIGDEVFDVEEGDVVYIPAAIPHWYQNTGDEPFEFLCIVPNLPDTTTIIEEKPC